VRQMFRKGCSLPGSVALVTAADGQEKVRIGVLNDQSGVFSTYQGIGSDESQSKWVLLKVVGTVSGEDAFQPEKDGGCPLVK